MNKASGGDGISVELFQILKDDAVKVVHSICQQIWTTWECFPVATGLEKVSFHSNPKERQCQRMLKLPHDCTYLTYQQSNAQNSPPRLQQYMSHELPDIQVGFRKGRGTRNQIANVCWIIRKAREFQENVYFCFIDSAKAFDCVDQNKLENSSRDGNTRAPDLPPEKSVCRSGSNSQYQTWNNRLVPSWEKSRLRLYIVTLLI